MAERVKKGKEWYSTWWGITGIILSVFLVIGVFGANKKGEKAVPTKETKQVHEEQQPTEKSQTEWVTLSGSEDGEVIIEEINVLEKPGSGGPENMAIGRIPHNTKVELLEIREAEGVKFYHVRSAIGKYSNLSTDWDVRGWQMEKLPEDRWFLEADKDHVVDGWVFESFIEWK